MLVKVIVWIVGLIVALWSLFQAIEYFHDKYKQFGPGLHAAAHNWWLAAPRKSTLLVALATGTLCAVLAGVVWRVLASIPDEVTAKDAATAAQIQAVLQHTRIVPRFPTTKHGFPVLFDLFSGVELRAISLTVSLESVTFGSGAGAGFIGNSTIDRRQYFEVLPANKTQTIEFSLPIATRGPDGTLQDLTSGMITVAMEFSIAGEVGRFYFIGDYRIGDVTPLRWDLVHVARGRVEPKAGGKP